MGQIIYKYGTMGSGKTIDLLIRVHYERSKGNNVYVWKPLIDNRTKDISSRAGLSCPVDYLIPSSQDDLYLQLIELPLKSILFIDEAQFLMEYQIHSLRLYANQNNISIYCYGLKTDFRSKWR